MNEFKPRNGLIIPTETASTVPYLDANKKLVSSDVTPTELDYLDGVTSNIQTQLDAKASASSVTDHLNDTTDAHDASAISSVAAGNLSATNVQTALDELQTDVDTRQLRSTLTTKGDLYVATGADTVVRLAVGADNTFLKADSGQSSGVIWASPSGAALAVTSKTTTYTATTADDIILASTSGGAWTLTLYAASGNSGKILRVKKTTNDFSVLTIDGNASETIDGETTTTLNTQYEEIQLVCDGSNWHILQRHIPGVVTTYTSTWGHSTNVDYTTSYWARDKDRIKIWGRIGYIGANTQGALTMTIPTGLTIDTAKITNTTRAVLGKHTFYDASADIYYEGAARYNNTTSFGFTKGEQTAGSGVDSSANRPVTFASGDFLDFFAEAPISGWKGN